MPHLWSSDPKLNGKIRLEIPLTRLENSPPGPCSICSQPAKNWDKTTKLLIFSALANHLNQTSFLEDLVEANELDQMIKDLSFCPNCMDFGRALFLMDKKLTAMLYEISQLTQSFREIMLANCPSTDPKHVRDFKALISKAPILHYVRRTTDYEDNDSEFKRGNFFDDPAPEIETYSTQIEPTTNIQPPSLPLEQCANEEQRSMPNSPANIEDPEILPLEKCENAEEIPPSENIEDLASKKLPQKSLFNLRPRNPKTRNWLLKRKYKKRKPKIYIKAKNLAKCQPVAKESRKSQNVAKENRKRQEVAKETRKSHEVAKESGKSQGVAKERRKSHEVTKETRKSQEVTKEIRKSHEVAKEIRKSHEVTKETRKTQEVTKETRKRQEITKETGKSNEDAKEIRKSHEVAKEIEKSKEVIKETRKSQEVIKETGKNHEVSIETQKCQEVAMETDPVLPEVDKEGFQEMVKLGIPFKRALIPITDLNADSNKLSSEPKKSAPVAVPKRFKRKKKVAKYQNKAAKKPKTAEIPSNDESELPLEKVNNETPFCKLLARVEVKLHHL